MVCFETFMFHPIVIVLAYSTTSVSVYVEFLSWMDNHSLFIYQAFPPSDSSEAATFLFGLDLEDGLWWPPWLWVGTGPIVCSINSSANSLSRIRYFLETLNIRKTYYQNTCEMSISQEMSMGSKMLWTVLALCGIHLLLTCLKMIFTGYV